MTQPPLPPDATVELVEPAYGYAAGARGVVVRSRARQGDILVRFDDTGHTVPVGRAEVRIVRE
jgi:hypothetical protein